ncbi:MAG: DOMON domain-containing protein [Spirochaetales bacterium]|nr:DOMON domain-containing protein [Spirochaetales bacterium]
MKLLSRKIIIVFFVASSITLFGENLIKMDSMDIAWKVIENEIEFTVSAKTNGWVAIGFEPSKMMKDADMILFSVVDGKLVIEDHYGNGLTSHKKDEDLGGVSSVTGISGLEKDGITTGTFRIPLNSTDKFDKKLVAGNTYKLIVAYGKNDNMKTGHSYRGSTKITL